jgi:aryl-alcohol dehydrogenase-like predicted oxidoreductase
VWLVERAATTGSERESKDPRLDAKDSTKETIFDHPSSVIIHLPFAICRYLLPMATAQKRKLGELTVFPLGLGCMGMSAFYGERDEDQAVATLKRAIELGIDFFDTADVYGLGHNEELVGRVLKPVRDRVIIATKFANTWNENGERTGISNDPLYIKQACDRSLQRLGTDVIDLYYMHRRDPNVPVEDAINAMSELVREGKVRFLGLSEVSAATLRRAHSVHPITALQTEYSLFTRDVEAEILPVCRELGVGFVAFSPLGRGILTSGLRDLNQLTPDDWRRSVPRFQGENFSKNLEIVEKLDRIAQEKNCTTTQLALAWVLAAGEDVVPIPGTKRVKYLEENVGALDVQLTPEERQRLSDLVPPGSVAGERYPEEALEAVDR